MFSNHMASPSHQPMASRAGRVAWKCVFLAAGLILLISPWSAGWSNNFFAEHYSWVRAIARNHFVRGAISGVGVADIWLVVNGLLRPPTREV